MRFEQPELATALRELAMERDPGFRHRRQTFVDYHADGSIERITWPAELGPLPDPAAIQARMQDVRQRHLPRQPPDPNRLKME